MEMNMTVATQGRKVMILGGRLMLKEYQVRGYKRLIVEHKSSFHKRDKFGKPEALPTEVVVKKPTYVSLGRVEIVRAVSALEAAKAYARSHQIRNEMWMDDSKPNGTLSVVIRVSDAGKRAP
jgi:hypothetical protein